MCLGAFHLFSCASQGLFPSLLGGCDLEEVKLKSCFFNCSPEVRQVSLGRMSLMKRQDRPGELPGLGSDWEGPNPWSGREAWAVAWDHGVTLHGP